MYITEKEWGREGGQQVGWQARAGRLNDKESEKVGGKDSRRQKEREETGRTQRETNRYMGTDMEMSTPNCLWL